MYLPKISIVIPAYNASNYLAEAIDSALAQSYKNTEIIVVNDGSRDDGATERIALSYGDKIRYISKENGGSSSALNVGIANMTGEWFSWLSHDDLYVPEKLEKQVECIRKLDVNREELSKHIFFSASELIDATGKVIKHCHEGQALEMESQLESIPNNGYLLAEPTKYIFHGCSCLIHKDVFDKAGNFDEHLRLLNDVDFWFRLYSAGYKVHYIPEALVKGRVHAEQVSRVIGYSYHNSEQDMFWNKILDWLMENYPNDNFLYFMFGRNAYLKTRFDDGDRAFAYLTSIDSSQRLKLLVLKYVYKGYATVHETVKKVYLKLVA